MNTDDLRNILHDQDPEGLDGEQVLHLARRARTNRRMGGAAVGLAATATAIAVAFGTGAFTGPNRADIGSAGPATTTRATTTPATTTPATTSAATTTPAGTVAASTTPAARVTGLCAPTNTIPTLQAEPGLMTVGPGGDLVVTSDGPNAAVTRAGTSTTILSLPQRQGVMEARTDGRFVVLLVALTANSDDPAKQVWVWDAERGGQATRFMSTNAQISFQVMGGSALIHELDSSSQSTVQLVDLGSGSQQVVYQGEAATASLLPDGTYSLAVPGPQGVRVIGSGPTPPSTSTAGPVTMYSPAGTNGTTWSFFDDDDSGSGSMALWSPAMPAPVKVFEGGNTDAMSQIGTNFALLRHPDGPWHLVDLRTGARLVLPAAGADEVEYTFVITADDVLLRDPMDSRSVGPEPLVEPAWVDLSATTLNC